MSIKEAIFILSYNDGELLKNLVDDLIYRGQADPKSIFILDNNSCRSTRIQVEKLKQKHEITLVLLDKNIGFASGVNYLFSYCVNSGFIPENIILMNQDCNLYDFDLEDFISLFCSSGVTLLSPIFLGNSLEIDSEFLRITKPKLTRSAFDVVSFTPAAFWILSTKTFEEFNGFDERFFMYGEDKNFCDRLIAKGKIVAVSNEHTVIHPFKRGYKKEIEKGYILSLLLHPTYSPIYKFKVISLRIVRGLFSKRFIDYSEFFFSVFYIFLKNVYSYNASSKVII